jgi:CRISPR-associated protein (TIGR02584 family)
VKTTLFAVSGMSPAIITETVWALAAESPPTIPDEVVVITTSRGEEDLGRDLLTPREDWEGRSVWEFLRRDVFARCGLAAKSPHLQLAVRVIELADAETGIRRAAPDLRSEEDNAAAADFIVHTLGAYTEAADSRVVASIAGGRKTMGALLYAAMSLIGREDDRVTHVLVSEPFETVRGFFYPGQPAQSLEARPFGREAIPVIAAEARVEIADIPFVPLRNGFAEMNEARRTFSGLVARYSTELRRLPGGKPRLSLDFAKGHLHVDEKRVALSGRNLLVASFLFERAKGGHPNFPNVPSAREDYLAYFNEAKRRHWNHRKLARYLDASASIDDITKALSELRGALAKAGLSRFIPSLAPERSRIGFDAEIVGPES